MNIGNLVYSFFNTPGPGGILILTIVSVAAIVYFFLIRWIMAGGKEEKKK